MPLHYSTQTKGLFSKVFETQFSLSGGCRAIGFAHRMFCVFRDEELPTAVRFAEVPLDDSRKDLYFLHLKSLQGDPALFTYGGQLYALVSGGTSEMQTIPPQLTHIKIPSYFSVPEVFPIQFQGTPAVLEYEGRLYLFYRAPQTGELRWSSTSDLVTWEASQAVLSAGEAVIPLGDVAACVYQGVIHLFHGTASGISHIRFDGDAGWSRSQPFIEQAYAYAPAVAVHDGLLNIFCVNPAGRPLDTAIYRYRYDGNVVGNVDMCVNMLATETPGTAVVDGHLVLAYRSI